MKADIHAKNYRPVVFQDLNDNTTILTRSTVEAEETIDLDGATYPLVKVHISSSSHPYFTGEERIVDIEGRVDKFKARREAGQKAKTDKATKVASQKSKVKSIKSKKPEVQKLGGGESVKSEEEKPVTEQ